MQRSPCRFKRSGGADMSEVLGGPSGRPRWLLRPAVGLLLTIPYPGPASAGSSSQDLFHASSTVNIVGQRTSSKVARSELSASGDLFADILLGPLTFHVYVEASSTPHSGGVSSAVPMANTDAGTALRSDGSGRIQVSELRFGWTLGERSALHAGLMDLTGFLDVSRIANDENLFFLGAPFVNNPTIAFPDYALGSVLDAVSPWSPNTRVALSLSSSHGIADNPTRSYGEMLDVGQSGKGLFLAGRIRWTGRSWRGAFGAWTDSSKRGAPSPAEAQEGNSGLFSVLGWASGVHAVSVRFGRATGSAADARSFAGVTYLWTEGQSAVGLGVARSGQASSWPPKDVHHAEAFVRRRLLSVVYVTASMQWLSESALTADERLANGGVVIAGVRLSASF